MPAPYTEAPRVAPYTEAPRVAPGAHLLGYPAAAPGAQLPAYSYLSAHTTGHDRQLMGGGSVLSDGELCPHDAGGSLSDGEIGEVGSDTTDVIGIVKERVGNILQLKDPKLLQGARLRALMLLLKCIRLDDPDVIFAHIKDAQLAVASELNMLAHEFRLEMIAEACMNAVLTTRMKTAGRSANAAPADTNTLLGSSADQPGDTATPVAPMLPAPADAPATTDVDSPDVSTPETDMDTSSDHSYDTASPELASRAVLRQLESPRVSLLRTPPTGAFFSRSRAPSPPNPHSPAMRSTPRLGCSLPISITPRMPAALLDGSSAVCSSERGRLVVFVDESDSSSDSGSETGSDSEAGTGKGASAAGAPATPPTDGQLLKAKMDLKEKEAAIARLKLQISQKQTRTLLRKKLQQSQQLKASASTSIASGSATAPSTPPVVGSSDCDFDSSRSAPSTVAAEPTDAATPEATASPAIPDPICTPKAELDPDVQPPAVAVESSNPEVPDTVATEVRSTHAASTASQLDRAIQAMREALQLVAVTNVDERCAQLGQLSARLTARQQDLEDKRDAAQKRLRLLQTQTDQARAELAVTECAIEADRECVSLATAGGASPGPAGAQAEALARGVEEISQLRNQIHTSPSRHTAPPTQPPDTAEASETPIASAAVDGGECSKQPSAVEMRAKLVAMRQDQNAMAQKLGALVEKRKQDSAVVAAPLTAKRQKTNNPDESTTSTRVGRIYDALAITAEEHIGPYSTWCADAIETLDSHILQPLVAVDGVGIPGPICPLLAPDARPATGPSSGPAGGVGPLPKVTTSVLLSALREPPTLNTNVLRQYYGDITHALETQVGSDHAKYISNATVARALRPIWRHYWRLFAVTVLPDNPLYAVLGLDDASPPPDDDGNLFAECSAATAIARKERVHVARLVDKNVATIPILSQCVAYTPQYAMRSDLTERPFRYFDAADPAGGGSSAHEPPAADSASAATQGDGPAVSTNPNSPDEAYEAAVRSFWKGHVVDKRPAMEHETHGYLLRRTNKDLGKVVKALMQAVQRWPDSERLWDLYLELFMRQRVPAEVTVAVFNDATKFHPRSLCIWRRYVVWCGWSAVHAKAGTPGDPLQARLSMVTAMALQALSRLQAPDLTERASATMAEIILHYWDCLWQYLDSCNAFSAPNVKAQPRRLASARLFAHMQACLTARTMPGLIAEISTLHLTHPAAQPERAPGTVWDSSEWALAGLLLPHHLLAVSQVFVSCVISNAYVPSLVLSRVYAALHARDSHRAVHYINLDNMPRTDRTPADKRPQGPPSVPPTLCNVLGALLNGLKRVSQRPDATRFDERVFADSRDLSLTSIKATTAQMQQHSVPTADSRQIDCEQAFWAIQRLNASGANLLRVSNLLADRGVVKFLLVAQALCAGAFPGDAVHTAQVAATLWDHAAHVARDAGIDAGVAGPQGPGTANGSTMARPVEQLVADTRCLYYRLFGYAGHAAPESLDALQRGLVDVEPDTSDAALIAHSRIRDTAGGWTNIALVELLHGSLHGDNSGAAVGTSLLWLRCGLGRLAAGGAHSRAQLWALVFRLTMTLRPLEKQDIVEMDRDLVQPADADPIQTTPRCYALVNFVMRAVLQAMPSEETLAATADYLGTVARSNRELAVR
ncbi:hypothetical protein H4R19_000656 [Coemansia spiralis]|nr:hypothetical protein H4R19_000656 [Coemansia spiralis]